jgi:hypothetical protein
MKLTITSTPEIVTIYGAPCRVWRGVTEGGCRVLLAVRTIAVPSDADPEEQRRFERELAEVDSPGPEVEAVMRRAH